MTRFKKMSKSTLAIVVLVLLLTCSVAFGVTYAYFTGTAGSTAQPFTTGHITLGLNSTANSNIKTTAVVPGDTLFENVTVTTNTGYVYATNYVSEPETQYFTYNAATHTFEEAEVDSQETLDAGEYFVASTEATNIKIYFELVVYITAGAGQTDPFDAKYLELVASDDKFTALNKAGESANLSTTGLSEIYFVYSSVLDYTKTEQPDPTSFNLGSIKIKNDTPNSEMDKDFNIAFEVRAIQADNLGEAIVDAQDIRLAIEKYYSVGGGAANPGAGA